MLNGFFVVTTTSVYQVRDKDKHGYPSAEKIALKGESSFSVGHKLEGGTMIAICKNLVTYFPEKYSWISPMTGYERRIENVNTGYWGDHTSSIVALFITREAALNCFANDDLQPCDSRWLEETKRVIDEIGDKHPAFEVCHWNNMALLHS